MAIERAHSRAVVVGDHSWPDEVVGAERKVLREDAFNGGEGEGVSRLGGLRGEEQLVVMEGGIGVGKIWDGIGGGGGEGGKATRETGMSAELVN